jgi:hypothetical protein
MPDTHSQLRDEDIEAEARAILRETIERSGWYPELRGEDRRRRIEQDVEQHWHLMRAEAVKRLEQRRGHNSDA